jgi:FixJ family two-component response regulator
MTGLLNKQIAAELGTSETILKIHRRQVMEKMGADSLTGSESPPQSISQLS